MPAEAKEEEQRQTGPVRAQAARQRDNRSIARAGRIEKPGHGLAAGPAVPAPSNELILVQRVKPQAYRFPDAEADFVWRIQPPNSLPRSLIIRLIGSYWPALSQVLPTNCGIPWLGFVVYPSHRRLKRRNAVNFTRRLTRLVDLYQAGRITFAELDASVQGWVNHVRYADTWGLREHVFASHPIRPREL